MEYQAQNESKTKVYSKMLLQEKNIREGKYCEKLVLFVSKRDGEIELKNLFLQ